jgi:hypothetical protein
MSKGSIAKIAASCAALIMGAADAASLEALPAERPQFHAGDVFEYVDRFQTVECKRWEFVGLDGDAMTNRCGDNVAWFAADTGALLRITGKGGRELVSYKPFAPAIPFPLQIGSKWGGAFEVSTAGDLITPDLDESCEVMAYETVRVVAGELGAFRFDCVTRWSVGFLHGTVTITSWYAPAAKTVVKSVNGSDSKWDLELASYRLQ